MRKIDVLIIGQGLAGTNLAFHLLKANKQLLIVDKFREITSSKVAAGLTNPITGRRFAKTWLADDIFPYSKTYYRELEQNLNKLFYHELPINRYFGSVEDQNTWMGRSSEPEIKPYVGEYDQSNAKGINASLGAAEIIQGGWLDTNLFLSSSRSYFEEHDLIIDADFIHDDLMITDDGVRWGNFEAKKIIFCEGFRNGANPYFSWLPFTFAKGEVIDVKIDGVSTNVIHNKNGFILPIAKNIFKVGATFGWNEMKEETTDIALAELVEKLKAFTSLPYQILNQKASIRPTTKDRRPFIGTHPKNPNILIFNGFGSKGVTLTPYFANHLVNFLENEIELNNEVNLRRYYKL